MIVLNIVMAKIWGGGEQYVYDTSKALVNKGIKVYIAVDSSNNDLIKKFAEVAQVITCDLYHLAGLKSFFYLKKFIQKNKIDIVNCHSGHGMLLCLLLKLNTQCKLVMFKHNAIAGKKDFYHCWQRKHTDAIICVSQLVYDLQVQNIEEDYKNKFYVVYNGIDLHKFNHTRKRPKSDKFIIGYAGRINYNKGIIILLAAFNELIKKYPNLLLKIAGQDESGYLKKVENYIKENKMENNVEYCGYIDDMSSFYNEIDVYILPTIVQEAFGLVLCEAMYSKVPVITTDSGAQKEIISNGIDGYLVAAGSCKELADALERVYLNIDDLASITEQGYLKVKNKFDVNICVEKLIKIYNKI